VTANEGESTGPVTLPGTESHLLHSESVGDDYHIMVASPRARTPEAKFPVVYLLDANGMFGTAIENVRMALPAGEVPRMIIVGIGYPAGESERDLLIRSSTLRNRDYTATHDAKLTESMPPGWPPVEGGGARKFLKFILEELKPYIEARFPADADDTVLTGHSLGGLFTMHALFEAPGAFKRYVASSPSLWWDNRAIFETERQFAAGHSSLPARLFMSVGSEEAGGEDPRLAEARMVANLEEMAETLQYRGYTGLELTSHVFDGESHTSVAGPALGRGLRTVFATR
jgi:predicted alpha/beta superfamily hydrolase